MTYEINENYKEFLMLVCMLKVFHDSGITYFEKYDGNTQINEFDYYWEFIMEAIQNAAPIVENTPGLYQKYGYEEYEDEVNVWAYSSKEMQQYFKIARKLHRLTGNSQNENPYETEIMEKVEDMRGFDSYAFDYFIGNKRKGARLEALWGFEFYCDVALCLWLVRVMVLFKEELPKLKEKYRIAKRKKRSISGKKGAFCYAE